MNIYDVSSDPRVGSARVPYSPDRLTRWAQDLFSKLPRTYTLPADEWQKRHRPMLILLWLHVPFLMGFGLLQGYDFRHVLTDVGLVAIMAGLGGVRRLSRLQRAAAVSLGLVTASGALVHLSGGIIEFHFHYFVMVVLITLYQDWTPLLLAVAFVLGQHAILGVLAPTSVYNHPDALEYPVKWALIHAIFLFATCVACVINWRVNENGRAEVDVARKRVSDILNSITDVFFALDREGRFTYLSSAAERLLQSRREDLVGIRVADALPASLYSELSDALRQAATEQTTVACQVICKAPDMYLEVRVYPAPDGLSVYMRDVTELRQVELELRQAQKLESVGLLASGIAHEINTPIQFIGNNCRFIRKNLHDVLEALHEARTQQTGPGTHDSLSERVPSALGTREARLAHLEREIPRAIDQTLDGVERVASIVRALKEYAHPDRREQQGADLNQALLSTLTVARNELKDVAEVETDLGVLPLVNCYIGQLNQVFLNLLINAGQAISEKHGDGLGQIVVRTRADRDQVRISISDTGCGIPKPIRERIFDPFFTTKDMGRGNGQGLTLARSLIVDKHKGTIGFETDEGKGTTFVITLPIAGIPPQLTLIRPDDSDSDVMSTA